MNFEEACKKIHTLPQKPTNSELLDLYGLYKQSKFGDINEELSMFDMVNLKKKIKWESWKGYEGYTQEIAKILYVKLVNNLLEKYKNDSKS